MLAGNAVPDGAAPLAQAYAGHQFGSWNPGLGDGRALLLGEVVGTDGVRRDIQLKGSGPHALQPDGRRPRLARAGPAGIYRLRGDGGARRSDDARPCRRDDRRDGAARGAPARRDPDPGGAKPHPRRHLPALRGKRRHRTRFAPWPSHARLRHYPGAADVPGLLDAVIAAQARLIARWMGLGFIHGVMNTDNMSVAGETIDYGPCAFMDVYHPATVFSSIDQGGRYAYQNQPQIALWNLAQFASALVPLMPDRDAAVESFTASLDRFADLYQAAWIEIFGAKLGLDRPRPGRYAADRGIADADGARRRRLHQLLCRARHRRCGGPVHRPRRRLRSGRRAGRPAARPVAPRRGQPARHPAHPSDRGGDPGRRRRRLARSTRCSPPSPRRSTIRRPLHGAAHGQERVTPDPSADPGARAVHAAADRCRAWYAPRPCRGLAAPDPHLARTTPEVRRQRLRGPRGPSANKPCPPKAVRFAEREGEVARLTGLEPATPGVTGRYSNQLSYNRA